MDLKLIPTLKEKLAKASDISSAYEYFLDHFGEDPEFLKIGKRTQSPELEAFALAIGQQLYGKQCVVRNMLIERIPNTPLIHGVCRIHNHNANLLYFDDVKVGVIGIMPARMGDKTQFCRFSGQAIPPEGAPFGKLEMAGDCISAHQKKQQGIKAIPAMRAQGSGSFGVRSLHVTIFSCCHRCRTFRVVEGEIVSRRLRWPV